MIFKTESILPYSPPLALKAVEADIFEEAKTEEEDDEVWFRFKTGFGLLARSRPRRLLQRRTSKGLDDM